MSFDIRQITPEEGLISSSVHVLSSICPYNNSDDIYSFRGFIPESYSFSRSRPDVNLLIHLASYINEYISEVSVVRKVLDVHDIAPLTLVRYDQSLNWFGETSTHSSLSGEIGQIYEIASNISIPNRWLNCVNQMGVIGRNLARQMVIREERDFFTLLDSCCRIQRVYGYINRSDIIRGAFDSFAVEDMPVSSVIVSPAFSLNLNQSEATTHFVYRGVNAYVAPQCPDDVMYVFPEQEYAGVFPIRQNITVLYADDPRELKCDLIAYQEIGIGLTNTCLKVPLNSGS